MPKKLTFDKWFESQFGGRTLGPLSNKTDADLRNIIRAGEQAAHLLQMRRCWDDMNRAALYAWVARDKT